MAISRDGYHGWQWSREIALKNSSVWTYDLATNTWRDMRPVPEVRTSPLRCAAYDSDNEVVVVFGGEGNSEGTVVYDLYTNTWTRMNPPEQPAFRSGGNMAYDSARKQFILFGAQFTDDAHTWSYDLKTNRWTDLKPKVQPPTYKNDAVLTYDPQSQLVIAVLRVREGKADDAKAHLETWAFDAGKNEWTKMNPPQEPPTSGSRARLLTYLPDPGVVLLENRTLEQQIWAYRSPAAKPEKDGSKIRTPRLRKEPPLVEDVVASVKSAQEVELTWKETSIDVVGYHVERAPVEVWTEDELQREKKRTPPLAEPSVAAIRRIGAFETLTKKPVKEKWTDSTFRPRLVSV